MFDLPLQIDVGGKNDFCKSIYTNSFTFNLTSC